MDAHAIPFIYSEAHLNFCAAFLNESYGSIQHCRDLFLQHAHHYGRPPLSTDEELFWNVRLDAKGEAFIDKVPSARIRAFLESVKFVHSHNSVDGHHRVGLNRFSDLTSEQLPFSNAPASTFDNKTDKSSHKDWFQELESLGQTAFIHLDSDEIIFDLAEKLRRGTVQSTTTTAKSQNSPTALFSILQKIMSLFHKNIISTGIFDSWWWIGERHDNTNPRSKQTTTANMEEHSHHTSSMSRTSSFSRQTTSSGRSFVVDRKNEMDGIDESKDDRWERYLNWSTEDNPDGVGIVHDAMDQGLCGSCWAISALGSLEASIVRNMAYMAYEESYKHTPSSQYHSKYDLRTLSISTAQDVELQSLKSADLSVQELVDCDTRYDQGCAGGNPLLAFYFLHRFGVTSASNYPYNGRQETCQYHKVDEPVATVETWGILTPDHENNMEKVLRYIGPVAVGLVGADPSFLAYKGGVFSVKGGKCDSGDADHAMLIVGYGEEENKDGSRTKYWIARNSWGTGWGENGYIKMERIGGRKGSRGVCEIARSPSVALGGMFTKEVKLSTNTRDVRKNRHSKGHLGSGNDSGNPEVRTESSQLKSVIHRIRARLGCFQEGIMMSTLNGSEEETKPNEALPLSETLGVMSLLCLLTYFYRKQTRRRERNIAQTRSESESTSYATNSSVICVCGDSVVDRHQHHLQHTTGEGTALLQDCSGIVAYT